MAEWLVDAASEPKPWVRFPLMPNLDIDIDIDTDVGTDTAFHFCIFPKNMKNIKKRLERFLSLAIAATLTQLRHFNSPYGDLYTQNRQTDGEQRHQNESPLAFKSSIFLAYTRFVYVLS